MLMIDTGPNIVQEEQISPSDIPALKELFTRDLYAFLVMISAWDEEQVEVANDTVRIPDAQKLRLAYSVPESSYWGEPRLHVGAPVERAPLGPQPLIGTKSPAARDKIVSEMRLIFFSLKGDRSFMGPFGMAQRYAMKQLEKGLELSKQLPYVRTLAAARRPYRIIDIFSLVQDRALRTILVDGIRKNGDTQTSLRALELVHEADLQRQLIATIIESKSNHASSSAVRLLARFAKTAQGSSLLETLIAPLGAEEFACLMKERDTRIFLVRKIIQDDSARYAAEALEHVKDEDLQEALVGVISRNGDHQYSVRALGNVSFPPLRQQLIGTITEAGDGSASAVAALSARELIKDPSEKEQLLRGVKDTKCILKILGWYSWSTAEDRQILVRSLVIADDPAATLEAFRHIPETGLQKELAGILVKNDAHYEAAMALDERYTRDEQVIPILITIISDSEYGSYSAARILWQIKNPALRLQLIRGITDANSAAYAMNSRMSLEEKRVLVATIEKINNPNAAREGLKALRDDEYLPFNLVGVIVANQSHHQAMEALHDVQQPVLRQRLITCIATAKGSSDSCVRALHSVFDFRQRRELIRGIKNAHKAVEALRSAKTVIERTLLLRTIANGKRKTAIEGALKLVEPHQHLTKQLERKLLPDGEQIAELTEELIDDDIENADIHDITQELFTLLQRAATKVDELKGRSGSRVYGRSQSTGHGEALDPELAARCILDVHRTRAFLKGAKMAIDAALEKFPGEEIIVLDPTAGPLGALNIPMALLFRDKRVRFLASDIIPENCMYHQEVVKALGIEDKYVGVHKANAISDRLSDIAPECAKPHVVIAEAMLSGFMKEPQIAILTALQDQVHPEAIWVPGEVRIYLELLPQKEDHGRRSSAPCKGIHRTPVTSQTAILAVTNGEVDNCSGMKISGSFTIPAHLEGVYDLYLCTEVEPFPGVVLPAGSSDISGKCLIEEDVSSLTSIQFEYPIGRGRENMNMTRIDADGAEHTRRPWHSGHDGLSATMEFRKFRK